MPAKSSDFFRQSHNARLSTRGIRHSALLPAAFLLMTAGLIGCGGSTNTVCPVMGNPVVADLTVEWNGKTVAFCCPPCLDEWAKMTDEERQQALDQPPVSEHEH